MHAAFEAAGPQALACLHSVSPPGGALIFALKFDGAGGRVSVESILSPVNLDPKVGACVRDAYASQAGPKFEGAPRVVNVRLAPLVLPPAAGAQTPVAANSHACPLPGGLRGRLQGLAEVLVDYRIETDGSVSGARVAKSDGIKDFDDAAVACVANWRYVPLNASDGTPMARDSEAIVRWKIE